MTINISHAPSDPTSPGDPRLLLLVGNPNVGKSVLFGQLTGNYSHVANYPGTTVEIASGKHRLDGREVVDTPGADTLLPSSDDERVTRDVVLEHLVAGDADVLQVADSRNLQRGVAQALELAELEVPTVFVANMLDEAQRRGFELDLGVLKRELGVEVAGTVAIRGEGTDPLLQNELAFGPGQCRLQYAGPIEDAVHAVTSHLPAHLPGRRGFALLLLAGLGESPLPAAVHAALGDAPETADALRPELEAELGEPIAYSLRKARLTAADAIVERARPRQRAPLTSWLARVGDLAIHPVWGWPTAAAILYVLYLFVGVLGAGHAVDFLETRVFEAWITPWSDAALRFLSPASIETFLVGPADGELGTGPGLLVGDYGMVSMALSYSVAIVLPIVGFFFIAFSVMEDSGYLPRLAVILNRAFKKIGLNGKAVLPMVLGLGCDTMATMTARILPTKKERIIVTLLLALAIPCSAQLGVILAMLGALSFWATGVWLATIALVLVVVGWLSSKVVPGKSGDFVLEIPPMRRPSLRSVVIKTAARIEWYLKEAVPLFILGTFVLWAFDRLKLLGVVRRGAAPVVERFLGLPEQATDAFLIGFLRRDYGAAGLYDLFSDKLRAGTIDLETEIQVVVSMVTITLFVPCIANVFIIIKERGWKTALAIGIFVVPFAFFTGGVLNLALRAVLL